MNLSNYQLYLVTDEASSLEKIEEAILGGVTMVQLREKNLSSLKFYHKALVLRKLTNTYNIPLIINDRVDIAMTIGAEGVHLGQKDLPVAAVKKIVGSDMIIGVSTATLEEALLASKQGADYLGVGAMYPTKTKNDTRPVSLETLQSIVESVSIPVVAIGGIRKDKIQDLKETGISGVAVVSEILKSKFPKLKAEVLKHTFIQTGGN
jgi:thiamine-phosphate pyrophosphorylase